MSYHRILVAYDGSEQAVRALKTVLDLAADWQAFIEVVHVYDIARLHLEGAVLTAPVQNSIAASEEAEQWAAEARSIIASNTPPLATEPQVLVLQGDPGRRIIERAQETKADLIVIGSRGLSGFKELFLGSVSSYVIKHALVPVHVVK